MFAFHIRQGLLLATLFALGTCPAYAHAEASATAGQAPLNLICKGEGVIKTTESSTTVNGAIVESERRTGRRLAEQTELDLFAGEDRIRMPASVKGPHRGADGWFKIKNLKVSDREISGQVITGLVFSPDFHIDRLTGAIELSGFFGAFSGQCQKFDPDKEKPLF